MRRISVESLLPGMMLGRSIYNERGDILLRRGVLLTPEYVASLVGRGLPAVYVSDVAEVEIELESPVSERVHAVAVKSVANLFEVIAHTSRLDSSSRLAADVGDVRAIDLKKGVIGRLAASMVQSVESIIDEVMRGEALIALGTLRSHDNYTFCHSVDMTISALLIAKKMFFNRVSMRRLALGCMLHDIGKTFISPSILSKPELLTPEEMAAMQTHPTLGYELLDGMIEDSMARHVVLQHHERQDGRGYPRGLSGTNLISRSDFERFETGRILLIAEIAAVADVYDALTSDRPYRPAYTSAQVAQFIAGMSGTHLNREIVSHFLSVLPRYPVGMDVEIVGGHYDRCQGVVAAVHPEALDRPSVLVLRDRQGVRVEPTEINLAQETSIGIRSVFIDAEGAVA